MSKASKYHPEAVVMQDMCDSLLSASLEASRLPPASQDVLRRQFEGRFL